MDITKWQHIDTTFWKAYKVIRLIQKNTTDLWLPQMKTFVLENGLLVHIFSRNVLYDNGVSINITCFVSKNQLFVISSHIVSASEEVNRRVINL